jgi:hypothetical protein
MTARNQSSLYYSSGSLRLEVEKLEDQLSPSIESIKGHHLDDPLSATSEGGCVSDHMDNNRYDSMEKIIVP